jgi:NAD(P)-dependent dehydrogenase (short-subunit alcohol dehydrogenase family)
MKDVDDWDRILRINARSVFLCYKHASKEMISRKQGGRIIGASSFAGKVVFTTSELEHILITCVGKQG